MLASVLHAASLGLIDCRLFRALARRRLLSRSVDLQHALDASQDTTVTPDAIYWRGPRGQIKSYQAQARAQRNSGTAIRGHRSTRDHLGTILMSKRTRARWTLHYYTGPSGPVPYQVQAVPAWRLVQNHHITSSSTVVEARITRRSTATPSASRSARSTRRHL